MIKAISSYFKRIIRRVNFEIYKIKIRKERNIKIKHFVDAENVILLLVPSADIINGGVLSLSTIYRELINQKNIHHHEILCVSHEYSSEGNFLKFTKFDNDIFVYDFKCIFDNLENIKSLKLLIADVYLENFIVDFNNKWITNHKNYLRNIDLKSICILNQNDMLMPKIDIIDDIRRNICDNIFMTMAHRQYASKEYRLKYNMPVHYLSAWLNPGPYHKKQYRNKENILVVSPDELSRTGITSSFTKDMLINKLKKELPNYKVVVIKNLTYSEYKSLMSNAKFAISLGEGLDGYFIEEILSGGISFAVINDVFFPTEYKKFPTIYKNYDELVSNIITDIQMYDNEAVYEKYHSAMLDVVELDYKFDKFQKRVKNMVKGRFDFP